jgi:hypothetical protein
VRGGGRERERERESRERGRERKGERKREKERRAWKEGDRLGGAEGSGRMKEEREEGKGGREGYLWGNRHDVVVNGDEAPTALETRGWRRYCPM